MSGVDRRTGRPLGGFDHVRQSLEVIFTTRIGARIMRRTFGSAVPGVLGQPLTPATMLRFWTAIVIAVELWEPRFSLRQVGYTGENTPERFRVGALGIQLNGAYRPRALQGDFAPETDITLSL